jgi:hypothetical protein
MTANTARTPPPEPAGPSETEPAPAAGNARRVPAAPHAVTCTANTPAGTVYVEVPVDVKVAGAVPAAGWRRVSFLRLEGVGVGVGVAVEVGTGVAVAVEVGTGVAAGVSVGTGVPLGVGVGVAVGSANDEDALEVDVSLSALATVAPKTQETENRITTAAAVNAEVLANTKTHSQKLTARRSNSRHATAVG